MLKFFNTFTTFYKNYIFYNYISLFEVKIIFTGNFTLLGFEFMKKLVLRDKK
jgi:hypothetical protein